jgi:two-component system sensor histidine kinase/response regulator
MARLDKMPIVAMTANAMEKDRQTCLQAGMNDVLVKPLDTASVWSALCRWIDPACRVSSAQERVKLAAITRPPPEMGEHRELHVT